VLTPAMGEKDGDLALKAIPQLDNYLFDQQS
jgi:hypothetical protein